jgi:hypothetical protein
MVKHGQCGGRRAGLRPAEAGTHHSPYGLIGLAEGCETRQQSQAGTVAPPCSRLGQQLVDAATIIPSTDSGVSPATTACPSSWSACSSS